MYKGLVRLCYRKVIDSASEKIWDRQVFEDTYREFFMQAQYFNQKNEYYTYTELVAGVAGAGQLNYLVSTAAIGYLKLLNERMPDVVDNLGALCVPFKNFKFEIIESHVENKEQHQVEIRFYSEPLTWIDSVGDLLLFAEGDVRNALNVGEEVPTYLLPLVQNLSIFSIKK